MKDLELYQCHKQVHATPMTRGAYNEYRGWSIPENENPEDEGYLVIHNKDTKDRHENWFPKHVFDDGHTAAQGVK